jgi:hypothetical protein
MYGRRKKKTQEDQSNTDQSNQNSKHTLKYDSIFKGAKNNDTEYESTPAPLSMDVHQRSRHYDEIFNSEDSDRLMRLEQQIHEILIEHTDLKIMDNRRKPSKDDYNYFYDLLLSKLDMIIYTRAEIFVILSYYFSENLFNMMRLLDRRHLLPIIEELDEKYKFSSMNLLDCDDFDEVDIV